MSARRAASFVKAPSAVPRRPATSYRSRPKPDEPPVAEPTTGQINALAALRAPLPHALRLSDIRVIYADKNLAVISKPSGLISQPDSSVSNGLGLAFKAVERKLCLPRNTPFYPVHRLDQRTTGCMLLPTSLALSRDIAQQFAARNLEKTYLALVRGGAKSFAKTEGVIEENLVLNDGRARKARKGEEGTATSTRWELLGSSPKVPISLLRLHPKTGHKHQLRIHCSLLEAPILGDDIHGLSRLPSSISSLTSLSKDHMYLHASSTSIWRFVKKADERARRVRLTITAPLPDEWKRLCKEIGIYLDPAIVKGGALVDGKDEVDEALAELGGRWLG